MWIQLEDGLYLFGEHGVNRIEESYAFNDVGAKIAVGTQFFRDTKLITVSKKPLARIKELLEAKYD